ncbi:MarR family winged helix-turn-helix transcriptional regulator [Achromobacter pestifer]|uniref:HTH marR-type domain-containing protein n=1 Tax=Achromobacter pestifer TaxID=1353889 RepID=A0A6S6YVA2_9BURK|nr:MarR family winged helix-turn-helix transcriptional regulator [Achromobacter pestifer]CAB3647317.1 hypothetical protein LMG3431_02558 [Achromobacter pestifer]
MSPPRPSGNESFDNSLSYTVLRLAHVMQRRVEEELRASAGITASQFRALQNIDAEPGIGSAALGRALLITPQSAGKLVEGLARLGHVRRDETAKPGTLMAATLTPSGEYVLQQASEIAKKVHIEDEAGLSASEAQAVNQALRRLLERLTREA